MLAMKDLQIRLESNVLNCSPEILMRGRQCVPRCSTAHLYELRRSQYIFFHFIPLLSPFIVRPFWEMAETPNITVVSCD